MWPWRWVRPPAQATTWSLCTCLSPAVSSAMPGGRPRFCRCRWAASASPSPRPQSRSCGVAGGPAVKLTQPLQHPVPGFRHMVSAFLLEKRPKVFSPTKPGPLYTLTPKSREQLRQGNRSDVGRARPWATRSEGAAPARPRDGGEGSEAVGASSFFGVLQYHKGDGIAAACSRAPAFGRPVHRRVAGR